MRFTKEVFSTVHALYIFKESIFYLYNGNDELYMNSLSYSMIYFFIDMFYSLLYDKNNKMKREMVLNHIIPIYVLTPYIYNNNSINEDYLKLLAYIFLSEASTIPLNICYIMNKIGKTKNIIFKISGGMVLILYIPFRLIMHPFVLYKLFIMNEYLYSSIELFLLLLNYYWFGKLLNKFLNSI